MNPEELALFREVADRSPAEREAYYADHHIDAALRAEIESVLRFDDQSAESLHDYVGAVAARVVTGRAASPAGLGHDTAMNDAGQSASLVAPLTGRRLGVFDVQGLLGAGGMGEVYRARDTRLGRDVAIKIIRRDFRDEREHVVRLEREARVLAALNHPHIGAVHGLEELDGLKVLVMELVEGETLAERLAHGSLPVAEALDVARQVADALETAHTQGIVHRDLKPANIKRRPDGTVKVLDFGLAKPLAWSADAAGATRTGLVGGTAAYMSPEQARGEAVDTQADIWSFGVVLFELLSGLSPFRRQTTPDTFVSLLGAAPDYGLLPPEAPPSVRHLIRRCLEKDRRRRLKHIGDARIELEEALASSANEALSDSAPAGAPVAAPKVRRARGIVAVAAASAVVGLVAGALWLTRTTPVSPVVRTIISADPLLSTTDRSFTFTPDGSSLAYISSDARQVFVRPLNALDPVAILTTAGYIRGLYPSPDGRWLGFIENNFTLKKISTRGGAPVTVLVLDGPSRGAAWGPDNSIVFATGAPETGLQRLAATGGAVTILTRPDRARAEGDHVQPEWLPGGRAVLFTIRPAQGGLDEAKVAVLDLVTGATHTVLQGGYGARYVDGYLVYAATGALWATRFDLTRLSVEGAPVEVLRPAPIDSVGAAAEFDIDSNGTLAYPRGATSNSRVMPVWVDRQGRETPLAAPPGFYRHPRLSPDGKRLAVDPIRGGEGDIYIWDVARPWSSAVRMTFASGNDWFPVWTPDGRRVVFGSWRGGRFSNLYVQDPESGQTSRLTDSPDMQLPTSITPDGTTVIFHSFMKSVQAQRLDGRGAPTTLVDTPVEERNADLSPDGRWLAYEGESTSVPGQLDVYVRPYPAVSRAVWQVTRDGGTFPLWSRNNRELFYLAPDGSIAAIPVEASATTWKTGTPKILFRGPYLTREGSLGRQFDVAPDGRFLLLKREATSEAPHLVIVQNWIAELARQVR